MTTPETASRKKPLRWAWWVVIPAVLLALFCVFFGTDLRRELIVRRLESQGVQIHFSPHHPHPFQIVPGLQHYQMPVSAVGIVIKSGKQAIALPQVLRDVRDIGGRLAIDLSRSDDLENHLEQLASDRIIDIEVTDRDISGAAFRRLGKIYEMRILHLIGCKFDNQALTEISQLKQLTTLQLDGSSISDEGLRHLQGLSALRRITLSNTQVSETAKEALCKALPKLDLSDD